MAWPSRRKGNFVDYRQVKKIELDGRSFDSKAESQMYIYLKSLEKSGEVKNIRCQVTLVLLSGPQNMRVTWRVDFVVFDVKINCDVAVEFKGYEDASYKLKLKIFRHTGTMPLRIYKGGWNKLVLAEEVYPDNKKLLEMLSNSGSLSESQPPLLTP